MKKNALVLVPLLLCAVPGPSIFVAAVTTRSGAGNPIVVGPAAAAGGGGGARDVGQIAGALATAVGAAVTSAGQYFQRVGHEATDTLRVSAQAVWDHKYPLAAVGGAYLLQDAARTRWAGQTRRQEDTPAAQPAPKTPKTPQAPTATKTPAAQPAPKATKMPEPPKTTEASKQWTLRPHKPPRRPTEKDLEAYNHIVVSTFLLRWFVWSLVAIAVFWGLRRPRGSPHNPVVTNTLITAALAALVLYVRIMKTDWYKRATEVIMEQQMPVSGMRDGGHRVYMLAVVVRHVLLGLCVVCGVQALSRVDWSLPSVVRRLVGKRVRRGGEDEVQDEVQDDEATLAQEQLGEDGQEAPIPGQRKKAVGTFGSGMAAAGGGGGGGGRAPGRGGAGGSHA